VASKHIKDITGQRFGAWLVIRPSVLADNGVMKWWCRCDCGTERNVFGTALRAGKSVSCGCVAHAKAAVDRATHGLSRSPTYKSWRAMWARCTNPKTHGYAEYGGAGIVVCERWKDFANFLADMGERPEGLTLDRFPNKEGNYEPGNVRWATPKDQAFNRSSTVTVMYGDEVMNLAEFGRRIGMDRRNVRHWIVTRKLKPEEVAEKAGAERGL